MRRLVSGSYHGVAWQIYATYHQGKILGIAVANQEAGKCTREVHREIMMAYTDCIFVGPNGERGHESKSIGMFEGNDPLHGMAWELLDKNVEQLHPLLVLCITYPAQSGRLAA